MMVSAVMRVRTAITQRVNCYLPKLEEAVNQKEEVPELQGEVMEVVGEEQLTPAVLPSNAKNITIKDTIFRPAVSSDFSPLRDPGPHLPPGTEIDPLVLFELYFDQVVDRKSTLGYAYNQKDDITESYCKFIK